MLVTELEFSLDNSVVNMDGDAIRSPGIHVSNVIGLIEREQGRLKGRDDVGPDDQDKWKDYRTAGFIIERVLRSIMVDHNPDMVRPGEICLDGIYMTPDYIDTGLWVLHEWKCTWRSWTGDLDDFWSWITQIKSYCKALGMTSAVLTVFFVNGDYKPRKPMFKQFKLTFEPYELDENWSMILNWSRYVKVEEQN